ncbi:MAG: hypothetical protein EON55_22400 [Alphaproteobacteria bacterium]|nr:MAG: hypothetical protein EON55_22400 [Alphaproteobacteria bacterium]
MAISFDEIRETMPDKAVKDDKSLEAALSILPVRLLLQAEPEEMGVIAHRFHARVRQVARGDEQ